MDVAVGAGADDYSAIEDGWQIVCEVDVLEPVTKALEAAKLTVKSSSMQFLPKAKKAVSGRDAEVCIQLADALDDHDDVQNVYADFDVSDEEMARLAALPLAQNSRHRGRRTLAISVQEPESGTLRGGRCGSPASRVAPRSSPRTTRSGGASPSIGVASAARPWWRTGEISRRTRRRIRPR
jgi:hypothetical protein